MLGAGGEVAQARADRPAAVTPDWQLSMGIAYPGGVHVEPGPPPPLASTAALRPVTDAYTDALRAAARHAAAEMAVRRLEDELFATRRRRRAIDDRMLPRLDRQVHDLELRLDELDRAEALRVRLAVRGGGTDP